MRQFEQALRGLGYSKREAVLLAKGGYGAIGGTTDEADELSALADLIARTSNF